MSRCWTCRRRRLKCDGAVPRCRKCIDNGTECLGYVKPLTWVDGVATRGPMKHRTFGKRQTQTDSSESAVLHPSRPPSLQSNDENWSLGTDSPRASRQLSAECLDISSSGSYMFGNSQVTYLRPCYAPPPMAALTEPLFKDLDLTSRFFIDYYARRVCPLIVLRDSIDNKYRDIIPLIASSPALASAVVAVASCHFTHSLMRAPVLSLGFDLSKSVASGGEMPAIVTNTGDLYHSKSTLINHYLRSKTACLNHLAAALSDATQNKSPSTLVTIVLLTILELCESGAGSWTIHIEGAKRLLAEGARSRDHGWDEAPSYLADDVSLFQTLGSSFTRPELLSASFTGHIAHSLPPDHPSVTLFGCPVGILSAVEFFSSQRRLNTGKTGSLVDLMDLEDSLLRIQTFDVGVWASAVSLNNVYNATENYLRHIGTIWKLSAEIYACRLLVNITNDSTMSMPSVDNLVAEYPSPELEEDDLIKCVIWPTFIAGAACSKLEHRDWALRTLDRIWQVALCANVKNAALVLTNLWKKQDLRNAQASDGVSSEMQTEQTRDWDWLTELYLLEDAWLFV